jgi:hypothetical protein
MSVCFRAGHLVCSAALVPQDAGACWWQGFCLICPSFGVRWWTQQVRALASRQDNNHGTRLCSARGSPHVFFSHSLSFSAHHGIDVVKGGSAIANLQATRLFLCGACCRNSTDACAPKRAHCCVQRRAQLACAESSLCWYACCPCALELQDVLWAGCCQHLQVARTLLAHCAAPVYNQPAGCTPRALARGHLALFQLLHMPDARCNTLIACLALERKPSTLHTTPGLSAGGAHSARTRRKA